MVEIDRLRRPFWMHQIVEYLVGIALISAAVQMPQPALPATLGLVVIINAAIATGGAGAFRLVGRRLHRWCDIAVMALLLGGALQPWISVDNTSRFLLVGVAFIMWFVWFHTDFSDRPSRAERQRQGEPSRPRPQSEDIGRGAGRVVGGGVNSLRRWRDSFSSSSDGD